MGAFCVTVGIGLTLLLVLFVIGSAWGPPPVDPEDDEEEDDTDLHCPRLNAEAYSDARFVRVLRPSGLITGFGLTTAASDDDSGEWLRDRMGWSVDDAIPCGQNWKRKS